MCFFAFPCLHNFKKPGSHIYLLSFSFSNSFIECRLIKLESFQFLWMQLFSFYYPHGVPPKIIIIRPSSDTKQWAGTSLIGLVLLTICIVSKTYAFTLSFVISHFSVVCGGGKWHNKPFHNDFCTWGWDFYSGFTDFWIFAWLFFLHPVFVL